MEEYGTGYGYIAYRTVLNRNYSDAVLSFESLGDRAQIYIKDSLEVTVSAKKGDVLTVLYKPFDTFLKLENFTKGFVTVNGFNIGRYWEIGPQKILYVPCSLLKKGGSYS